MVESFFDMVEMIREKKVAVLSVALPDKIPILPL